MIATLDNFELVLPGDIDRQTWLDAREKGIGGSDVSGLLGVSKWDGALVVYGSKVYGYEKQLTDQMDLGQFLEPWIVGKFARRHPELVVYPKPGMFRGTRPWHLATPDAVAHNAGDMHPTDLVEAKTATRRGDDAEHGWGDPDTDEVPYGYLCQVTWTCMVRRLLRWHIPVLFDGREYREYSGEYSPALGAQLAAYVDDWWLRHIVARVEPRADGFDSTRLLLNERHIAARKSTGVLPEEAVTAAAEYLDLRDQRKEIEDEMSLRANLIRQAHVAGGFELGQRGESTLTALTTIKNGSKRLDVKDAAR